MIEQAPVLRNSPWICSTETMLAKITKGLRQVRQTPLLFAEVCCSITLLRAALAALPLARVLNLVEKDGRAASIDQAAAIQSDVIKLYQSVSAIAAAERPCLLQALGVKLHYKRRGIATTLRIGVRRTDSGKLLAHAWLEYQSSIVIGGPAELVSSYNVLHEIGDSEQLGWA